MGYKSIVVEIIILAAIFDATLATIYTQEQAPANENVPQSPDTYSTLQGVDTQKPRFSRSPSNQIRFGRSQSFVRFGRSNAINDENSNQIKGQLNEKLFRLAHSNGENLYSNDENIRVETRGHEDNGFIRFGRSQSKLANKNDEAMRSINWRNFLRLGRNTNANIRFAGKRDGSSTHTPHNLVVPLDVLVEKYAQQRAGHRTSAEAPDTDRIAYIDDDQILDDTDANVDQTGYSSALAMDN